MSRPSESVYRLLGASNHTQNERQKDDLYCTHPDAVKELLKIEEVNHKVWECCAGMNHIANELEAAGHEVWRSDLYSRGYDNIEEIDFLKFQGKWDGDIVTNFPYSNATAFVRKAMEVLEPGRKLFVWLRILYLESKERKKLFEEFPPLRVWISSRRIPCGKEGQFGASAQGYAWYVMSPDYKGDTILKWF